MTKQTQTLCASLCRSVAKKQNKPKSWIFILKKEDRINTEVKNYKTNPNALKFNREN
jgi:hypothetical protein